MISGFFSDSFLGFFQWNSYHQLGFFMRAYFLFGCLAFFSFFFPFLILCFVDYIEHNVFFIQFWCSVKCFLETCLLFYVFILISFMLGAVEYKLFVGSLNKQAFEKEVEQATHLDHLLCCLTKINILLVLVLMLSLFWYGI